MGNRLCKKKGGDPVVDGKPHPFDRLINRLHLRPTTWKSDPQLSEKQVNKYEVNLRKSKNGVVQHSRPLSNAKSSDWTEATLEVPDKDEVVHLKNPQLSLIFNDNTTPTPPPRKNKKTFREKLESVAKNGLQALQTKKAVPLSKEAPQESPKPVEEPPFIKKTIIYGCPLDDHDHSHHNRDHKHRAKDETEQEISEINNKQLIKDVKRKKNLSVVSLPNINEFRFSIKKEDLKRTDSGSNLVENSTEKPKKTASTGKLETYMHRCRSIGSLIPQKLKQKKSKTPHDIESDDSFGGLEDWDCKILEHYKPKDASLQRPRKPLDENKVLSDVENLIVSQEEYEKDNPPVRPLRRSESLVNEEKRTEENAVKPITNDLSQEPLIRKEESDENTQSIEEPLVQKRIGNKDERKGHKPVLKGFKRENGEDVHKGNEVRTPPPTPVVCDDKRESMISISKLVVKDEQGNVEHSSLIKLLHEYSKKEAQEQAAVDPKESESNSEKAEDKSAKEVEPSAKETKKAVEEDTSQPDSNLSSISMTPSLIEFEKAISTDRSVFNAVEDFLDAERRNNAILSTSKPVLEMISDAKCQVIS